MNFYNLSKERNNKRWDNVLLMLASKNNFRETKMRINFLSSPLKIK